MNRLLLLDEPFAPFVIALIKLLLDVRQLLAHGGGVLVVFASLRAERFQFLTLLEHLLALRLQRFLTVFDVGACRGQFLLLPLQALHDLLQTLGLPATFGFDLLPAAIPDDAIGLQLIELLLELLLSFRTVQRRGISDRWRNRAGDDRNGDLNGSDGHAIPIAQVRRGNGFPVNENRQHRCQSSQTCRRGAAPIRQMMGGRLEPGKRRSQPGTLPMRKPPSPTS